MSSYIKELLNLKEQITQSTNNIIKKYDSLEMELLEKAKNKLNKQYDSLLEGIEGRRMQFDFTTYDSVTRQKYKMEFLLCSNVPFDVMQSNYGNFVTVKINNNERIILNSNYNGYCVGIGKLEDIDDTISKHTLRNLDNINNTITYKTDIIKILTKYSKQIDEEFIQVIEEKLNFSNKLNLEKLNNKIDLIQTLENYIYNE